MKNFEKLKRELKRTVKTVWYCIKYAMPSNKLRIINLTKEIQCLQKCLIDYCKVVDREDIISKYSSDINLNSFGITDLRSTKERVIQDFITVLKDSKEED